MNNPYQAPGGPPGTSRETANTSFLLAAIGAWLASAYWAAVTLLIGLGAALGSNSGVQLVLPALLIVFYALRGAQVLKGDKNAARRLLYLHIVGGVVAVLQMASAGAFVLALQGAKVIIHIFGGITAEMARRA